MRWNSSVVCCPHRKGVSEIMWRVSGNGAEGASRRAQWCSGTAVYCAVNGSATGDKLEVEMG